VDGGSWVINDALSTALELVGLLHTQLTATIDGDAAKLDASYEQYRSAEDNITLLVTAIASPGTASPGTASPGMASPGTASPGKAG
jgi:hypothetical protein